jgi:citrate lyase gamma subunit
MIEYIQRQIIFEEAARSGILSSQIQQIPQILRNILGTSDIGTQVYGGPLAPLYLAKSGELIEIPKIANFFTGLARDIKVTDVALSTLENELLLFNLEIWTRMQLAKNRAQDLSKRARVEKTKASLGAAWVYTETFSTTKLIDMNNTTAWIDTSEGIAFIPNSGDEKTIPMHKISLISSELPSHGNYLSSTPKQAFDGMDNTNWRCLFVTDEWTSSVFKISESSDITAITIDPVGFGIDVKIEVEINNKFEEAVRSIIYAKKTFPVSRTMIDKIKVSYKPATSVLPKVVGIREIVLYQTISTRLTEVHSQLLKPSEPFTEVKLETKGEFPQGTKVTTYFRTSTAVAWTEVVNQDWHPVYPTDTLSFSVNFTDAVAGTSSTNFRGLYAKALNLSSIPITNTEGSMEVGINMVEVSTFKKDWIEEGQFPRVLTPEDFASYKTKRTWSDVTTRAYNTAGSGTVLQLYGETTIKSDLTLSKGGPYMIFQRKLDSLNFPIEISQYNQLCIVPLIGAIASGMMQFNYNYKMSFMVYAPKSFSYQDARYWFYQGYRLANRRLYKDIGKSYGTFSLYINDILVVGEEVAKTISTDHKINDVSVETIDLGNSFSLNLNAGWNKVEILMNVFNPDLYGPDAFDVPNEPYLQLSLYPSLFDTLLANNEDTRITKILASSSHKPVNEFDLLWNLPKEPTFWSWSDDRQFVLFNTNELKNIDGYYLGSPPVSNITYKSIQASNIDDLYIRIVLEREDSSKLSPLLDEYNLMVR